MSQKCYKGEDGNHLWVLTGVTTKSFPQKVEEKCGLCGQIRMEIVCAQDIVIKEKKDEGGIGR